MIATAIIRDTEIMMMLKDSEPFSSTDGARVVASSVEVTEGRGVIVGDAVGALDGAGETVGDGVDTTIRFGISTLKTSKPKNCI